MSSGWLVAMMTGVVGVRCARRHMQRCCAVVVCNARGQRPSPVSVWRRHWSMESVSSIRRPKFVDFKLSDEDALEAVQKWLPKLAPNAIKKALQEQHPTRAFLPFWTYEVEVHSKFRGEVGVSQARAAWEPEASSYSVHSDQNWRDTQGWLDVGDRHFAATIPEMQVYAGFTFRRQNVQALKGSFVKDAVEFDPSAHQHALEGATVYPYEMTPEFSWSLIRARINDLEAEMAEAVLKQYYAAESVRYVRTKTTVLNCAMQAVYMPAYIFTVSAGDRVFRTFVSGVSGEVGGQKIYSSVTLGTIASVVAGAATSVFIPEPTTVAFAAGLPGVVAGALTKLFPGYMQARYDERLRREIDRQRQLTQRALDEGVQFEHQARELTSQARADRESIQTTQLPAEELADPEAVYAALGLQDLKQNASLFDIKEHFRRAVWHVYPQRLQSSTAQREYEAICAAYRRLRNDKTRWEYDERAVEARRKELAAAAEQRQQQHQQQQQQQQQQRQNQQ
ncbi:hypothetical protein PTSG_03310 [Salpingoeca rosetta]|uniref:J domain-containing protein n=1 Tax=Salpingoeca rosetta (strain ATCC 50818 / BSB-021) TaxID=946362 RepID=F2U4T6_SALR5|nr:uncharacterized protein PTSG_03310 [Salpingoeca rosetta]EGD82652.1 hypothetical protein PTSG_03310 [Salpingoeca rosetta]|eukprot:XP_004995888.1 hypothetical protein PTSG_03310 [Salpingoeca rosetta]